MGYLKYVKKLFQKPTEESGTLVKQRMIQWRAEPVTVRIERPTRIDRARALGYKPKPGVVIVRQRVTRVARHHDHVVTGRGEGLGDAPAEARGRADHEQAHSSSRRESSDWNRRRGSSRWICCRKAR